MELSRLNSNKCNAVLRFKQKNAERIKSLGYTIAPNKTLTENREIDKFGELAVKRLERRFCVDFSESDVDQVIADYKLVKSTVKVAEHFHCSKNVINNLLKQHGIEVTKYAEKYTIEKIAKLFGVSTNTINKYLHKNGVKMRSRWDYPRQ